MPVKLSSASQPNLAAPSACFLGGLTNGALGANGKPEKRLAAKSPRENAENERLNRSGRVSGLWREKRGRGGGGGGYI